MPSPIRSRYAERRIDQICITCWLVLFNYYYGPRTDPIPFMPLVRLAPCKDWPVFIIAPCHSGDLLAFQIGFAQTRRQCPPASMPNGPGQKLLEDSQHVSAAATLPIMVIPTSTTSLHSRAGGGAVRSISTGHPGQLSLQAPVPPARQSLEFSWLALHARSEGLCKGLADAVEASHSGASRLPSGALRTRDTSTTTWEGSTW
jgi:hypothetical protein